MTSNNLIRWLPFNKSPTYDVYENIWLTSGTPTVNAKNSIFGSSLQLDGSSYIWTDQSIQLGGQDFAISFYFSIFPSTGNWPRIFILFTTSESDIDNIDFRRNGTNTSGYKCHIPGADSGNFSLNNNTLYHFEWNYSHSESVSRIFIDGQLKTSIDKEIPRMTFSYIYLGKSNYNADSLMTGIIDEFQIYDGRTLHTDNFTPPSTNDYLELYSSAHVDTSFKFSFDSDIIRNLTNRIFNFEHSGIDNISTDLTVFDTPIEKSQTGTGFYRTQNNKCFDVPIFYEVVMDFDIYFYSNNWKAVNGGTNGNSGIIGNSSSTLSIVSNGSTIHEIANCCIRTYIQNFRLHMISGLHLGLIEVFMNGELLYTYHGNVNKGNPFNDLYLQSDNANTFFSNFYISSTVPEWITELNHFNMVRDVTNIDYVNQTIANENLLLWMPFLTSATEDYCGNPWISNNPNLMHINYLNPSNQIEHDTNHETALYLPGEREEESHIFQDFIGQITLNCQGFYLGGEDFTITLERWYGGGIPFSSRRLISFSDSAAGDIYIDVSERWSPDWELTTIHVLDQTSPQFTFSYRTWWYIRLEYSHQEAKFRFYLNDSLKWECNVYIPRLYFPRVDIDRAHSLQHGSGFISTFKVSGGEIHKTCIYPIFLCVRHNGEIQTYPLRPYRNLEEKALAVRYNNRNWYNILRHPSDPEASDFYIKHNGKIYALSLV